MTTIQFDALPFISPGYNGDHYKSIRYQIRQWMIREFKQNPSKIYVDMKNNRGSVTFNNQSKELQNTLKMIRDHPMGQIFFDWRQRLKTRKAGSPYPLPRFFLPDINYVRRFAECRYQAMIDSQRLDEVDIEEEGSLSSMLLYIANIEANEALEDIDIQLDELQLDPDPEPVVKNNTAETHPLILEFSSDEEDDDDEDEDLEELPEPPTNVPVLKMPYHEYWVAVNKGVEY
jgi:hypothetical protein